MTGDATYKATYTNQTNSYTVKFVDYDGRNIVETQTVAYNGTATVPADPTRTSDQAHDYRFTGWTPDVAGKKASDPVTGNVTFTATYESSDRQYTITWNNDLGVQIDTTTVAYGQIPTHEAATKAETDGAKYTFAGWTADGNLYTMLPVVTGDATYKIGRASCRE